MKEQTPLRAFVKSTKQQPARSWKGRCLPILFGLGLLAAGSTLNAQTYTPLTVSGYTQDVIAESGTSSMAVTSTVMDGVQSNAVFYSKTFAAANGSIAGGLPDNGIIVNGSRTYQMAPYTGPNALYISSATTIANTTTSATFTLATPGIFSKVSALLLSTEGTTTLKATLNFTDGTTVTTANQSVLDWFYNTTNLVVSGLGRISRASTGPYSGSDASGGNPRMYYWDILIPCASQGKTLASVTFTGVSVSGCCSRASIFALSGAPYTPDVIAPTTVIPAHCGTNSGLVTMAATGNAPFTYSWNTTPVQTGSVASNLAAGSYTCTVTNSLGCAVPYPVNVTAVAPATLTATAGQPTLCSGNSTTLTVSSSATTPATYTWTPGGQSGASITVSPTTTTTYTVNSVDYYGCTPTTTVKVTVNPSPSASFTVTPDPACVNTPQTVTFTGTAGSSATYDWSAFAGATVKSGTGAGPYSIQFTQPGSYNVQLKVTENGCTTPYSKSLTILGPAAAPVVTIKATTTTSITFGWQAVPGATGYQVSVNGGAYIDPSSGSYGTTHTVTGLSQDQSVSINVIALAPAPCQSGPAGTATGKTLHDPIFAPNSFSPNGDGKNDVFKIYSTLAASIDLKIFSQWGELLFSTSNMGDGWDGTYKGKAQPSGVYIFAVRVKLLDGTEIVRKGAVNLLH